MEVVFHAIAQRHQTEDNMPDSYRNVRSVYGIRPGKEAEALTSSRWVLPEVFILITP
jgi:hypothetical protein